MAKHVTNAKREVTHSPGSQHDALFPVRVSSQAGAYTQLSPAAPLGAQTWWLGSVNELEQVLCDSKVRCSFPFCLLS